MREDSRREAEPLVPSPRQPADTDIPARGWRARRTRRAEAANAAALANQIAHAQRRARQVAYASQPHQVDSN